MSGRLRLAVLKTLLPVRSNQVQRLSADCERLLSQLHQLPLPGKTRWPWRRDQASEIADFIVRIAERGEAAAISSLVHYLLSDIADVRLAAARGLSLLLSPLSDEELLQLDWDVRDSWEGGRGTAGFEWRKLKADDVDALAADPVSRIAVLGLLSCHPNGFVRESAVRLLAEISDGSELPYLLIRLNDWVTPVAEAAATAVKQRLTEPYLPHLLRHFALILRLPQLGRRNLSDFARLFVDLLTSLENHAVLAEVIRTPNRALRRGIVRMILRRQGAAACRIVRDGLASEDAIIRLWCAREVAACFGTDEALLNSVFETLVGDRSMPVRRQALRVAAKLRPQSEREIWRGSLLDPSVAIRELAQVRLRTLGGVDVAEFYRMTLLQDPQSLPALSGLGEKGDARDLATLRTYLSHAVPKYRSAALRGIARIAAANAFTELVDGLCDMSPKVVRLSAKLIRDRLSTADVSRIYAVVRQATWRHSRFAALGLIFEAGKWRSMPWMIKAIEHWDQETCEEAARLFEMWFTPPYVNRVFTRPSADEWQAIQNALDDLPGPRAAWARDRLTRDLERLR